jgi:hypothetical protein
MQKAAVMRQIKMIKDPRDHASNLAMLVGL